MKNKISNFLIQLDLLGNTPCMYIQNDKRYRSVIGGSFSIIWFCSILFSLLFFGQELWQKLKPITNSSTVFDDNPSNVQYFKDFELFFGINDGTKGNKYFIDDTVYTVAATLNILEPGASVLNKIPISVVPCNRDSFYEKDLFSKYNVDGFWCVDKNQKQNISISGIYGKPGFKMIQINFDKCINSTKIICKPSEEIDKYITGTYFSLFSIQNFITTNDYENPLKKGVYNHFFPVSTNSFTDAALMLRTVEIISDVGLLNDKNEVIQGFTQNSFQTQIILNSNNRFTTLSVQMNNIKEKYFRSYMKLQNLFALIGGFINFIKISLQIIFSKYYENDYFSKLIKNFFQVKEPERNQLKIQNDLDKQSSKVNLNNYLDNKTIIIKNGEENYDLLTKSDKFCGPSISKIFCKSKVKDLKNFELMRDLIKKKLDVISILRTEFDFAKMRYLTLTNEQNRLFNILDKINILSQNEFNNFIKNPNYVDFNQEISEPNCELGKKIKRLISVQTEKSILFNLNKS